MKQQRSIALAARALIDGEAHRGTTTLEGLHTKVVVAAVDHWMACKYRSAVFDTAQAVSGQLRQKLARLDLDGVPLVQQAFGATAGQRLRFPRSSTGSGKSWANRHLGALHLGTGLFFDVRNVRGHADPLDASQELDPDEAFECLAAFSLLARWIDATELRQDAHALPKVGQSMK